MSFESIELDFDDSEDKNSEEKSDEKSISNDLISQGSKIVLVYLLKRLKDLKERMKQILTMFNFNGTQVL